MSADTKYMSIKAEDVIKQLKRNEELKRSSKIRLVRQGCWELILLVTNIYTKVDMYAIHYKGDEIDHRRSGYITVYRKNDDIKVLFNSNIPKYLEQKAIVIAKAIEKEGYRSIAGK